MTVFSLLCRQGSDDEYEYGAKPYQWLLGWTYQFYIGKAIYMFGDGLSNTKFNHHHGRAPKSISILIGQGHSYHSSKCKSVAAMEESHQNLAFGIHLKVKNEGTMSESHTIFLFSSLPSNATVLIVSIDQSIKVEGRDRLNIQFPGQQPLFYNRSCQGIQRKYDSYYNV